MNSDQIRKENEESIERGAESFRFSFRKNISSTTMKKKLLPLHMPGHQRKRDMGTALPYTYDYTEVEELDNLHAPEGILQEAMNRTAAYYGCSDCFYLVKWQFLRLTGKYFHSTGRRR